MPGTAILPARRACLKSGLVSPSRETEGEGWLALMLNAKEKLVLKSGFAAESKASSGFPCFKTLLLSSRGL